MRGRERESENGLIGIPNNEDGKRKAEGRRDGDGGRREAPARRPKEQRHKRIIGYSGAAVPPPFFSLFRNNMARTERHSFSPPIMPVALWGRFPIHLHSSPVSLLGQRILHHFLLLTWILTLHAKVWSFSRAKSFLVLHVGSGNGFWARGGSRVKCLGFSPG